MSSAIEYDGYRIDETSQILIRLLRDMGRQATAGELRAEAGLDETRPIHYRYEEYLGPAGLVLRAGTEERPGGAQDEIVYGLSDEGVEFAVAHENELTDAVAAAEAVDTLRRIRATVDGFEERVSEVEDEVDGMGRWKSRWRSRVNRVENDVEELEDANLEEKLETHERWIGSAWSDIDDLEDEVDEIEDRLDHLESEMEKRPTYDEVEELLLEMRERPRQWDIWLAEDIADVRKKAEGILGGRL